MEQFKNVDDILDFAIKAEQQAVDFYTELAVTVKNEEMKEVFQEFAMEEIKHKSKLMKIKEEKTFVMKEQNVLDLKVSDYIVPGPPTSEMTYQDALIVAMNREKSAFKLYMNLSAKSESAELKSLFLSLAQEESKHKLRFELEYDEYVLREN